MIAETLSEQGNLRRQQILQLAKKLARRRQQRRSIGQGGGIVASMCLVAVAMWLATRSQMIETNRPVAVSHIWPATFPLAQRVEYIQTDPTITDRLSIRPEPPRWTAVGDDELLKELAAAGQPAGIVCMNGKTFLLPR